MSETVEIDLREAGRLLVKRIWLIVLCAVLVGAAVLVYTVNFVTPMYQAQVKLFVNNNSDPESGAVTSSDLAVALRLVNTYVEIIKCDAVQDKVIDELDLDLTAKQLRKMISAKVVENTEIFGVTVTTPDPQMSADIANTIAKIAPSFISEIINGSNAKVIDYAVVPTERSSPSYVTNTMLGAIAGAVLAMIAILASMYFDVHVKNEETLERICNVSVLGAIPDFVEANKVSDKVSGKRVRR